MQIKKLVVSAVVAAVMPFALLGCPDKAADTKPDPAASAKPAAPANAAAAPAQPGTAAPAKSGAGW